MATRSWILGSLALLISSAAVNAAATVRTTNFVIEAPTQELAHEFGKLAEHYRKSKAIEWLGQEMPRWPSPCPLRVTVTVSGAKGATTFTFPEGQVYQTMFIEGPLDRLRYSVLPHEITHTVLAHHFRRPVPRWADEGGSVYSEDDIERTRHDQMCRQILNAGRGMPLRRLFGLKDYPNDVMVLYAQGYSVTRFLVEASDRQTFLNFVSHGMQWGWDEAVKTYYRYRGVNELEEAWLDSLRKGRPAGVARNPNTTPHPDDLKLVVRQNVPPAQPVLDPLPIGRGQAPAVDRSAATTGRPMAQPAARLGDPIPFGIAPQPQPMKTVNASMSRPRTSPPPVVLFPPEPLPLR